MIMMMTTMTKEVMMLMISVRIMTMLIMMMAMMIMLMMTMMLVTMMMMNTLVILTIMQNVNAWRKLGAYVPEASQRHCAARRLEERDWNAGGRR